MELDAPLIQSTPRGRETARLLLDIAAVNVRPDQPYIFTSGWASPVYIDCRWVISFVAARRRIVDMAIAAVDEGIGLANVDAVAGGETAGIPYAAWIAEATDKPMLYVRKKTKGFGRDTRIEGRLAARSRVLLVEDLATDGASKLSFVEALRRAEAEVTDAFVVFYYGVFPGVAETLAAHGLRLHHLATWWDVLAEAERGRDFPDDALAQVRAYIGDPIAWSAAHGGKGADSL